MITEEETFPQGPLTVRPVIANGQRNNGSQTASEQYANPAQSMDEANAPAIITLQDVTKRFRDIYALRNVSVTIRTGQVFGLLGPTGAGKSTLLKLVMGWLHPDEGTISVLGSADAAEMVETHRSIGYIPEQPVFHLNFTGWEYLNVHARLAGMTRRNTRASVERAVETIGAHAWIKRRISFYTAEMLQRLSLGVALVGAGNTYPALLVIDEPSTFLNRAGQSAMRDVLLECKRRGSTILMASHKVTEVERICDMVGIMKAGKLVTEAAVENNPRIIIVAVPRADTEAETRLAALTKQLKGLNPFVRITGGTNSGPLVVSLPAGDNVVNPQSVKARALRAIVDSSWDVISVYVERKDLENIYAQTLSPVTQAQTGPLSTGPLGPMSMATGPLGPHIESPATGPLNALSISREGTIQPVQSNMQPLGGRFTGPLGEYNGAGGYNINPTGSTGAQEEASPGNGNEAINHQ